MQKGIFLKSLFIIMILCCVPAFLAAGNFNYAEALQKTIWFYEVQQSGPLPEWNRVEWREDSTTDDGGDNGLDLTGGWFDAGDHVKFGFPMAASVTTIVWGALEYREGYELSGQMPHLLQNLRFVNDYFLKAHIIQGGATARFYGQVGKGSVDHSFWGSPEMMTVERPSYYISPSAPGSDLAAETAAALASSSMLFRDSDSAYADTLLENAKILYTFADQYRGAYDDTISDASAFYHSFNGYIDDLAWGAAWLCMAVQDQAEKDAYLAKAEARYSEYMALLGSTPEHREYNWIHNWNDKYFASSLVLAKLTGKNLYMSQTEKFLDWWTSGYNGDRITYTPGGLAWLSEWGPNRYASNAALLAFIYGDWISDESRKQRYLDFAVRQIDYILGDNPLNMSYLIGFGNSWPQNPHHRAGHGSWLTDILFPANNRHIIYGALCGGPAADDSYKDERGDYCQSEVACDYNAAILGNLARLCLEFDSFSPDPAFPQPEERDLDEFSVQSKVNASGAWGFQPMVKIINQTSWPPRAAENMTARYFFTVEEGKDVSSFSIQDNGGQSGVTLAGPLLWDDHIYYVELDLSAVYLAPGGYSEYYKDCYFTINDATSSFDESDDFSAAGMTGETASNTHIPLYENGVLVWGEEPPRSGVTPTPAITPVPVVTPTPVSLLPGDVNLNDMVDIVDALMIAQFYVGLNPPGFQEEAADVNLSGTVNIVDALIVAQYYVGLVSSLPVR